MQSGMDWGLIGLVFGGLFVFGFVYDRLIAWCEGEGYAEGYLAMLVAFGTLITLLGVAVIDWRAALLALGAFCASGFWMIVGSWWRHVQARRRAQDLAREGR